MFNSFAAQRRSERQSQATACSVRSRFPARCDAQSETHRLLWSSCGRPHGRSALRYQTCCCNMKDRYFLVVVSAVFCTGRKMWPSLVGRHVHSGSTTYHSHWHIPVLIVTCACERPRIATELALTSMSQNL